jgi:3,4-dihydroxy 2-butanone 4-phosphate synthase/GTP cyclohydrolase II
MVAPSKVVPSPLSPSPHTAPWTGGETAVEAELEALCHRVRAGVEAFRAGRAVLVGDDGRRENEADLVFHAAFATTANVNAALRHARGLLCVSVGHELADTLGFAVAPRTPGDFAHTGFTLAVDARENITSGISAHDRAVTIRLMAEPKATASDFLSPGHVFPVRAHSGGLLARTGHTEALQELCTLAGLAPAAAMCEVLADDGEALRPAALLAQGTAEPTEQTRYLASLPYLSTVDLLWHRVFFGARPQDAFVDAPDIALALGEALLPSPAKRCLRFQRGLEEAVTCEALVLVTPGASLVPERVRIVLSNGLSSRDNGVDPNVACAEIRLHAPTRIEEPLDARVAEFCDLSAKIGLGATRPSVRRIVTQLRALEALPDLFHSSTVGADSRVDALFQNVAFVVESDRSFLLALRKLNSPRFIQGPS